MPTIMMGPKCGQIEVKNAQRSLNSVQLNTMNTVLCYPSVARSHPCFGEAEWVVSL